MNIKEIMIQVQQENISLKIYNSSYYKVYFMQFKKSVQISIRIHTNIFIYK